MEHKAAADTKLLQHDLKPLVLLVVTDCNAQLQLAQAANTDVGQTCQRVVVYL